MIFEKRFNQCLACKLMPMCKYSEIYYKNKGEWPDGVPKSMVIKVNGNSQCAHAPYKI